MPALHSSLRKAIKDTFKPPSLRIRNESQPSMTVVLPERDTAIWPPGGCTVGLSPSPVLWAKEAWACSERQCQQPTLAFLLPGAWPSALLTQNPTDPGDHVWDSQCGQRKSGWSASVSIPRLTKGWIQSQYSPYRTRMPEHICLRLTSSSWSKVACWVGDISSVVQEEALCPLETQQPSLQNNPARQLICSAVQRRQPEAANETCRTLSTSANAKCFRLIKYLRNLPTP